MNDYNDYMNQISAEPALHERILARTEKKPKAFYRRPAFATLAASMAVVLIGVLVIPGLMNNQIRQYAQFAQPEYEADDGLIDYAAGWGGQNNFHDRPAGDNSDTLIPGPPIDDPYTPIPGRGTPALQRVALTLHEARHDPHFGTYIPATVPEGFAFESAYSQGQGDTLLVSWSRGMPSMDHIAWVLHFSDEHWENSIVCVTERERYDVSLYSIPWFDSVPEEHREVFNMPVFRAEELSLDVIQARQLQGRGRGPSLAPFAVLFGDVIMQPRTNGVTPEQLYNMLSGLG